MYLFQTYHNKSLIPPKVYDNIKQYASKYKHIVYDYDECLEYIKTNYDEKIANTFINLQNKAHKADLWRYCILYKEGGLYMDIKVQLIGDINNLFDPNILTTCYRKNNIFNGIIYSPKDNPIFLELIDFIVNQPPHIPYQCICKHFAKTICKYTGQPLDNKLFIVDKIPPIYLFEEIVKKYNVGERRELYDRYKLIDKVYDKGKYIIKARFSDYTGKINSW